MTVDDTDRLLISDDRAIRALINPVRILAVDELYRSQTPVTATRLAHLAGVSPSAMSYHLRELASFGIIRRADAEVDGRERPWRAVARDYSIVVSDEGNAGVRAALLDLRLDPMRERMLAVLATRADRPLSDRRETFMVLATGDLYLTEDEYAEAQQRIDEVWRQYEARGAGRDASGEYRHAQYIWACLPLEPRLED